MDIVGTTVVQHLDIATEVGEVGALICDEDGYVVICSCDSLACDHVGKQVPESYRRGLELKCMEEESNREIARRLGLKESTVATRVLRGRTMLAAALEKEGVRPWMSGCCAMP